MASREVLLVTHGDSTPQDYVTQRLRALGYATHWVRPRDRQAMPEFRREDPDASYAMAVVYGGPQLLSDIEAYPYLLEERAWLKDWVEAGGRTLGICLGGQMLAQAFGAEVKPHKEGLTEVGYYPIEPCCPAFDDAPRQVYHWHVEGFDLPSGGRRLATGETYAEQAFSLGERAIGLQFHPEVTRPIMRRWVRFAPEGKDKTPGAQDRFTHLGRYDAVQPHVHAWTDRLLSRLLPGNS